jgi:hypothetical protein
MEMLFFVLALIGAFIAVIVGVAILLMFGAAVQIAKKQVEKKNYEDPFSRL